MELSHLEYLILKIKGRAVDIHATRLNREEFDTIYSNINGQIIENY